MFWFDLFYMEFGKSIEYISKVLGKVPNFIDGLPNTLK